MKTTVVVDEVGRLVLPKPVREAIGISGRMSVSIEVVGDTAQISTTSRPARSLIRKGGRTVYAGPLPAGWESGEAVSRIRQQRVRR